MLGVRAADRGRSCRDGPVLIAAKHESAYETLALMALLDDPVIVLKREIADVPLFGRLTRRHGVIPVDRDRQRRGAAPDARAPPTRPRAQARAVLIFPEGTRVPHGEAPPLQAGFAGLYGRLGAAGGAGRDRRRAALAARLAQAPGVIRLRFGAPIPPGLPRKEIEARGARGDQRAERVRRVDGPTSPADGARRSI